MKTHLLRHSLSTLVVASAMLLAGAGVCTSTAVMAGVQFASPNSQNDENNPKTPSKPRMPAPEVNETTQSGQLLTLMLDRGQLVEMLNPCIRARLPGFPEAGVIRMLEVIHLRTVRYIKDAPYIPKDLVLASCEAPEVSAFLDIMGVMSTQDWFGVQASYESRKKAWSQAAQASSSASGAAKDKEGEDPADMDPLTTVTPSAPADSNDQADQADHAGPAQPGQSVETRDPMKFIRWIGKTPSSFRAAI